MSTPKTTLKQKIMSVAEVIDAIRLVPRLVLVSYATLVYWIVSWYIDFTNRVVTTCDSATLDVLLREGIDIDRAQNIACSITEVIGHPTGYTMLVSTIVGAAAVVFGLYTNSGRKWGSKPPSD